MLFFFFFNDTATTEIYTLSLHDALPISARRRAPLPGGVSCRELLRARDGAHRERVESEHPAAGRAFPGSAYREARLFGVPEGAHPRGAQEDRRPRNSGDGLTRCGQGFMTVSGKGLPL